MVMKRKRKRGESNPRVLIASLALAVVLLVGAGAAVFIAVESPAEVEAMNAEVASANMKQYADLWFENQPVSYQYDIDARMGDTPRNLRITIRNEEVVDVQQLGGDLTSTANLTELGYTFTMRNMWGWMSSYMSESISRNDTSATIRAGYDPTYGYPTDFTVRDCSIGDSTNCMYGFKISNFTVLEQ